MGSLSAAHRGYAYQDLVTAYLLVRALVHQHEAVIVDRKTVEDDRFDDLEVTANGTRIRRQLKIQPEPRRRTEASRFHRPCLLSSI